MEQWARRKQGPGIFIPRHIARSKEPRFASRVLSKLQPPPWDTGTIANKTSDTGALINQDYQAYRHTRKREGLRRNWSGEGSCLVVRHSQIRRQLCPCMLTANKEEMSSTICRLRTGLLSLVSAESSEISAHLRCCILNFNLQKASAVCCLWIGIHNKEHKIEIREWDWTRINEWKQSQHATTPIWFKGWFVHQNTCIQCREIFGAFQERFFDTCLVPQSDPSFSLSWLRIKNSNGCLFLAILMDTADSFVLPTPLPIQGLCKFLATLSKNVPLHSANINIDMVVTCSKCPAKRAVQ